MKNTSSKEACAKCGATTYLATPFQCEFIGETRCVRPGCAPREADTGIPVTFENRVRRLIRNTDARILDREQGGLSPEDMKRNERAIYQLLEMTGAAAATAADHAHEIGDDDRGHHWTEVSRQRGAMSDAQWDALKDAGLL
jgi:hypothetical protein